MIDLRGKNAWIGGSSKGIGLATAELLAEAGANITLIARNEKDLDEAVLNLDISLGQQHQYIVADYSNLDSLVEKATAVATEKNIHILVNNTGGPPAGTIQQAKPEEFLAAFKHHVLANQVLSTLFLEGMKQSGYGRIVNIISTSVKQPLPNLGVSNTIRAAVANWAKTWANEVAIHGITVNNVLPGATSTERLEAIIENSSRKAGKDKKAIQEEMYHEIPMRRFAEPSEIAAAVLFLASPLASYITGINLPVDGGRTKCL